MCESSTPRPQNPEIPAKTSPAPTKADSQKNGCQKALPMTPMSTRGNRPRSESGGTEGWLRRYAPREAPPSPSRRCRRQDDRPARRRRGAPADRKRWRYGCEWQKTMGLSEASASFRGCLAMIESGISREPGTNFLGVLVGFAMSTSPGFAQKKARKFLGGIGGWKHGDSFAASA